MVSRVIPVEPFDLILFGATGDLARRKILPSLFHRFRVGQFDARSRIIASSRGEMSTKAFRQEVRAALHASGDDVEPKTVAAFVDLVEYVSVDAAGARGWDALAQVLREDVIRAIYLSVSPSLFGTLAKRLQETGIATARTRIVVEKPFGHDLASAQALNADLRKAFREVQIYRIDHYLGKETVQNLMALRFANSLFEPLWNASHIDHVQITVAETIGVEGRGAYYDQSGAMRDMIQNHLMQLLCLTAMEPPSKYLPDAVRDEKVKVIESLDPVDPGNIVRGQYQATGNVAGYGTHAENPDSRTESFVALKVQVANWRWAGTPFYLRTGKCLRARMSEIAVFFRDPPHMIFPDTGDVRGNILVIRLQPDEGITLHTTIKDPGPGGMRLSEAKLDLTFAETLGLSERPQDAYERLIMDVIRGDQTLFMRSDEVEAAWAWSDPVIADWANRRDRPQPYDIGSSGPDDALLLLHRDGRRWRGLGA